MSEQQNETSALFRKKALDRLSSPDQLDTYMKATTPSVWVVLAAILVLAGALLVWGVFGTIPTTVSINGISDGKQVTCFLSTDQVHEVNAGDTANVMKESAVVTQVSEKPLTTQEVSELVKDDYLVSTLQLPDWSFVVTVSCDKVPDAGQLTPVVITATKVAPISFLVN